MTSLINKIQIFILCRNRPEYIFFALRSFCNLKLKDLELIISDNSSNNLVQNLILEKFPDFIYRRRDDVSVYDHFNKVISETNKDFVVIFHDDDVFLPGFAEEIYKIIELMESDEKISAVGTNAILIDSKGKKTGIFNKSLDKVKLISKKDELVKAYINPSVGIVPFPSYIYRTEILKKFLFNDEGIGKYSDVIMLLKILQMGKIVWWPEMTMGYRVHESNDSKIIDLNSLENLCEAFKKIENVPNYLVRDFFYINKVRYFWNIKSLTNLYFFFSLVVQRPLFILERFILRSLRKIF